MHPLLAHTRPSPTTSCTPRPRAPSWTAPRTRPCRRTLEHVEVRDERVTTTAALLLPTPNVEPWRTPRLQRATCRSGGRRAPHTTLFTTPQEWEALGHGSRAQRVTQAYEKRCKRMGGGWDGGLIGCMGGQGWLGSRLKYGRDCGTGKLIFA